MAQIEQANHHVREETPEPLVIPSQYRLQEILETEDPLLNIPPHVIEYYRSRGLILVCEEGGVILATPKANKKK